MAVAKQVFAALAVLAFHVSCTIVKEFQDQDLRSTSYLPQWSYVCIPDVGCQRIQTEPSLESSRSYHPSLDVCRATCGRFSGLWPRPATAALSSQTLMFHPMYMKFNMNDVPASSRQLLVEMTRVITDNMLAECEGEITTPESTVTVNIDVKVADVRFNWDTDESYILDLQTKRSEDDIQEVVVYIGATTIFGARHGLETLSQMVSANTTYGIKKECSLNLLTGAKIKDSPVYPHRGLMLDTARNFIPVENIKRTIDGMGSSKMNVLHWHATDSQSFPLQSSRVPLLTKYGAYSEIYSVEQIEELLHYALVRGVRMVLEIDSPAHAGNGWQWGKDYGLGDLAVCVNAQPWRQYCIQPPCGQLNPVNSQVYNVLRDLYTDIIEMWPKGEVFHMGGDEVFVKCWNNTEEIVAYMVSNNISRDVKGFLQLWSTFQQRILTVWDEENRASGVTEKLPVMLWSSQLTQAQNIREYLDKRRYVIEVWEPVESPHLQQLVSLGYRVVSAPKNIWYLDHGFWGTTKYSNWRKMYAHSLPRDPLVLGGEVAMWSEYVDESGLDARVWPRAAAVAERLWSDPPSPPADLELRMQRQRARLVARGIRADVISPQWCTQNDKKCS